MLKKEYFYISLLILFAFTIDRLTKFLFINKIITNYTLVDKLLLLKLHQNYGIALGVRVNPFFYYLLVTIILFILFYLLLASFKNKNLYLLVCQLFIIIGAISNLIDRLRWGAVIDFIQVRWWSIFNLADCYIVGGVIFWLLYLEKSKHEKISKKSGKFYL